MTMAHQSFSKTIYDTAIEIAAKNNGEINCNQVSIALGARTGQEHKNILNILSQFYNAGKLQRLRKGIYAPIHRHRPPDKRETMWRVIRMRKRVTADDLVELAFVGKEYAREWLQMLTKREVVRKIQEPGGQAIYMLIRDTVEMPKDEEKAARLRELRNRRKAEIVNQLEAIEDALKKAKEAIVEL